MFIETENWDIVRNHDDYIPMQTEFPQDEFLPNSELEHFTPCELFTKYWPDEFLEKIAIDTNNYAAEFISKEKEYLESHRFSVYYRWKPINYIHIKKFIALILLSGIVSNRTFKDNWSKKFLLKTPLRKIMPYKLYQLINKFIRISDESGENKLCKVIDLISHFNQISPTMCNYTKNLAIDEILYPFKGRLVFKQYIKSKPHKYGIKYYLLASSITGYLYYIKMYSGKDRIKIRNKSHPHLVIEELISNIKEPRVLYMDCWWTTMEIVNDFTNRGWGIVGVIAKARLRDRIMKSIKLNENEFIYYQYKHNKNILITVLNDTRQFYLISNCLSIGERQTDFQKPVTVETYIKFAKGVDNNNRLCANYRNNNRTKRWARKVFRYLIEVSGTNAYIIGKHFNSSCTHKEFILSIVNDLIN